MAEQSVGSIFDTLHIELGEGDLVASAMVIAKVIRADGSIGLAITSTDGTDWLDRLALVTAANEMIRTDTVMPCACDDEDNLP